MEVGSARLSVAVETPLHAGLDSLLSYSSERTLSEGSLVRVPLGRREVSGIVWGAAAPDVVGGELRRITEPCDAIAPLAPTWRALVEFAASYYQRGIGEIALSVLPAELRRLGNARLASRVARTEKQLRVRESAAPATAPPSLSDAQAAASQRIAAAFSAPQPARARPG